MTEKRLSPHIPSTLAEYVPSSFIEYHIGFRGGIGVIDVPGKYALGDIYTVDCGNGREIRCHMTTVRLLRPDLVEYWFARLKAAPLESTNAT